MGRMSSLRRQKSLSPLRQRAQANPPSPDMDMGPLELQDEKIIERATQRARDRRSLPRSRRPRTRYRTWYRVSETEDDAADRDSSPGYCIERDGEGHTGKRGRTRTRRSGLVDTQDLRRRLLASRGGDGRIARLPRPAGDGSLIVVDEWPLRQRVADALVREGGVDAAFLDAHARNAPWVSTGGGAGVAWEYPVATSRGGARFRRMSLWTGTPEILLVGHGDEDDGDEDDGGGGTDMEGELLDGKTPGEIAYRRWIGFLGRLLSAPPHEPTLRAVLSSLERNQDSSRFAPAAAAACSYDVWTALVERVHRHLVLRRAAHTSTRQEAGREQEGRDEERDKGRSAADRRSLDRLSYLGGVLLPVTVVSGVVSIGGQYGPGGGRFWVFWLASLLGSVGAVIVIYLDQVRTLPVWIEVAVDAVLEESEVESHDGEDGNKEAEAGADRLVVRRLQMVGGEPLVRAWRRRDLGWAGALKKVSGYYRWRGMPGGMLFHVPPRET